MFSFYCCKIDLWTDLEDAGKGDELTASIFKILYATADGFEPADEQREEESNQESPSDEHHDESQQSNTVEPEEEAQDETY